MKILNPKQLKLVDEETVITQHISSWDLMERASSVFVEQLLVDFPKLLSSPVFVVCGKGNNGGDGLAIARILKARAGQIEVFLLKSERYSQDNVINQEKLGLANIHFFTLSDQIDFANDAVIIDCLFGYGLETALSAEWQNIIGQINGGDCLRISVDMPSGLSCETHIAKGSPIIHADIVYTFQVPKLNLLLPEYAPYVEKFSVLDIGLDNEIIQEQESSNEYVKEDLLMPLMPKRKKFSHKGTYGHALVIGGSYGKLGAVLLAAKAALRSGCGLISAGIPNCGHNVLQTAFPEAMLFTDDSDRELRKFDFPTNLSAIGIGVGMGTEEQTFQGFSSYLQSLPKNAKLVLDADALNILALHQNLLTYLPADTICSPHPKELSRLIGAWESDYEKLSKAKAFAAKHQIYLIVKGANSVLLCPDGALFFNSTGNPGMATGGSGDVLTGILTSLRAQGYHAKEAAILGMYIHGLAGDLASAKIGEASLIASDIIQYLPAAFNQLVGRS
ncbi:NAD(P)H-hydrate dehydratase [Sphingobacterium sp. DK4209]|uniref:Bifunctional NAD(P)H-hydrate repair enzyme n=1 Tax=Sphingobacterium zhuxiongii TaxID=2662364 RepID=A0A5Q0Q6Y0_9SPHI|nr:MULTISPECIES: NAD(P)H-hydrate dehydratase [unclassified Sphingobacterium]MVZ64495.1 NAD(P)H-hydrate dehydratase [Sphingobacterium sp. DK4209]QGA25827.1 NAD(P)H-hydrate dehydratase [Sphingobacterium sp. dk4302]